MGDDLKNLGRKSWIQNVQKPAEKRESKTDSGVVTRYAAVPSASIAELQAMVARDPGNLELKDMLAFSLYSSEKIDEAVAIYKDLLNHRHRVDNQRLYLGNCYYKKKLFHLAVMEWEHVAKMEDADPELRSRARQRVDQVRKGMAIEF